MQTDIIVRDYIIPIGIAYLLAFLVHIMSGRIAGRFVQLSDYAPYGFRPNEERKRTLRDLLGSTVAVFGYVIVTFFAIGRFVDLTSLIWVIGLFGAGFGLGARPLISDYISGISFIFENSFSVGEKVVLFDVEGVVEKINLRTVVVRSPTGEVYTIPNGEIRLIRNFSRGLFSVADVTIKVNANDLEATLNLLESIADEALVELPNLLEHWQIISPEGVLGQRAELKLVTKAKYGKAAELRPRLLAFINRHLTEAEIAVVD